MIRKGGGVVPENEILIADEGGEKAVLCGLITRDRDERETEVSLDELERLLDTAGGVCAAKMTQAKESPDPATYLGSGKLGELAEICKNNDITLAVFDDELSPSQIRNVEDALDGVRVIDRTMLILDIFAKHAVSGAGKLQVELAQLRYSIPRLAGHGNEMSRLGGGIGTRGPGESKLETDRRHVQRRILALKEALADLERGRETQRRARTRSGITQVAIVGYTNAGKSTLLNRLTGAGILVEDKLFATLDPTTRKFRLPCGLDVLLTDTVGFIRRLPHHLIEAFKSTLDELKYADVIMVLIDASDPECGEQLEVTHKLLWDLGVQGKPTLYVYNKCDREIEGPLRIQARSDTVFISAATGEGIKVLIRALEDASTRGSGTVTFEFPISESRLLDRLYRNCVVSDVQYGDGVCRVRAIVDAATRGALKKYIVEGKRGEH